MQTAISMEKAPWEDSQHCLIHLIVPQTAFPHELVSTELYHLGLKEEAGQEPVVRTYSEEKCVEQF